MASDGQLSEGFLIHSYSQQKIFELDDGRIVGICGSVFNFDTFLKWLSDGAGDLELEDFEALVLNTDGTVRNYIGNGRSALIASPAACGSGSSYALAAMDAGLSPAEAVKIAINRDAMSGGTVREIVLKKTLKI